MTFEVVTSEGGLEVEKEVFLTEDGGAELNIHPWDRGLQEVYVQVSSAGGYDNIIVPREEFVDAILAVFPELKRAEEEK